MRLFKHTKSCTAIALLLISYFVVAQDMAPINFATNTYTTNLSNQINNKISGNACEHTLNLYDSAGDGWNGASITLYINGVSTGTNIFNAGNSLTIVVTIEDGDDITIFYNPGSNEDQVSYELLDAENNIVFSDGPNPALGVVFEGTAVCPGGCTGNAGTMSTILKYICHNNTTNVSTFGQTVSDNDVLTYALHTSSDNTLGAISATNSTGSFTYADAAETLTTYYISPIVGPDSDGDGVPELDNPCTSIAAGTPVLFLNDISVTVDWEVVTGDVVPNNIDITIILDGGLPESDGSNYVVSFNGNDPITIPYNTLHQFTLPVNPDTHMASYTLSVSDFAACSTDFADQNLIQVAIGINETANNPFNLQAYPIPVENKLQIQFNNNSSTPQTAHLNLYDTTGRLVYQKAIQPINSRNTQQIDMQNYTAGLYLLVVQQGNNSQTTRVFKN